MATGTPYPESGHCIVCGNRLSGEAGVRFCSADCRRSYQKHINERINQSAPDSNPGIRELKEMIFQYVDYADSITDQRRLEFYENVVEKTALLLKYVNDSGNSPDAELTERLKKAEEGNRQLREKLDRLLQKAAELKRENKKLRQQNTRPATEVLDLARMLLGVKPETGVQGIKKAYRYKAKITHPDSRDGDADLFKAVTEAMIILLAEQNR